MNSPVPTQEERFLARLRQGDAAAGHRFVQEHYPGVYRSLIYLSGHRETAEDLAQETFLQAWRHLDQFQGRSSLQFWLHRIARREFLRSRGRQRAAVSLEEVPDAAMLEAERWTDEADLRMLLDKLPEEQREVVFLHSLAGYSSAEIARILQAPASTIRARLSAARLHLQRELDEGDLSYLNEPAVPMRQWAWLPLDQMHALETRLAEGGVGRSGTRAVGTRTPNARSKATTEETMERREFLRQAAVGAAGLMLTETEKEVVDDRLTQKVTCAFKATALADLCEKLKSDTGVQVTAGPSVADEKVTLFCQKLSLREVMRQLSRPFGYTWLRSGTPGQYRYELVQDLRSQLLEEELRNRDRNAALLALDQEVERYRPYLSLSPDEARAQSGAAAPEEKRLLEHLAEEPWGAIRMYFRLSPQEHAALRAGQTLVFSVEPRPGEYLLPADLAHEVLESCRNRLIRIRDGRFEFVAGEDEPRDGLPPVVVPEARAYVELRITEREPGRFTFDGGAGVRVGQRSDWCVIGGLAAGVSPTAHQPRNSAINHRLAGDARLGRVVTVQPEPACPAHAGSTPPEADAEPRTAPMVTTADVIEALHRATGLPIVADYYTRLYPLTTVTVIRETLFNALNHLADSMRLCWRVDRERNWLQFRSTSYYDDRLKEVPNRLLARWMASRQKHGALTLDDLAEIACLSDAQLDSVEMAQGARECSGLAEWDAARNGNTRAHLRLLSLLLPAQRLAAASAAGLALDHLSPAQQPQFLARLLRTERDADWESFLAGLRGITLRVDYTLPGWYEWRAPEDLVGPGWAPLWPARVRERTLAAALQAVRRSDPNATEVQITPTDLNVIFIYTRRDGESLHVHGFGRNGHWRHQLPDDRPVTSRRPA